MVCTRLVTGALAGVAGALLLSVALQAQAPRSVADAAQRGDREAVKTLLKEAADVNAAQGDGMTALHWAAMNGDAEMAQMLLVAGGTSRPSRASAPTRRCSWPPARGRPP